MASKKQKMPRVGDLVLLRWLDISEDPSWRTDGGKDAEVANCESVGWVCNVTRSSVTLTRSYHLDGDEKHAGDAIVFPRGCVSGWSLLAVAAPVTAAKEPA